MKFIQALLTKLKEVWQTIQDILLVLIMLFCLPLIFIWAWLVKKAYKELEDSFVSCPHGYVVQKPHVAYKLLGLCKECRSDMRIQKRSKNNVLKYEQKLKDLNLL